MAVPFKGPLNADTFNNAFVSKDQDSVVSGKVSLTNSESGDPVVNLQTEINSNRLDALAAQTTIDAHIDAVIEAHDSAAITHVPEGGMIGTTVKDAINEINLKSKADGATTIQTDGGIAVNTDAFPSNFIPDANGSRNLGAQDKVWSQVHSGQFHAGSTSAPGSIWVKDETADVQLQIDAVTAWSPSSVDHEANIKAYKPGSNLAVFTESGDAVDVGGTGRISIETGNIENTSEVADTGSIKFRTGTTLGTGNRGEVSIEAHQLNLNGSKVVDVADPTSVQDAATKKYVDGAMTEAERDAIVGPTAGQKIFNTTTGRLNIFDGNVWAELSGSGSSGGSTVKNYLQANSDAENGVGDWTTFHDDSALVNGTGIEGSMFSSFLVSGTGALRGTASYNFVKYPGDQANAGFSIDFTLDNADKNKNLYFSCDFEGGTGYVVDDLKWAMYEKTTGTLYKQGGGVLKATSTTNRAQFVWPAGTDTALRLICYVANSNSNSYTAKFDNMRLGPDALLYMPIDRQVEINCAGSGNFTGGTLLVTRSGRNVTVQVTSTITYASTVVATSAVGLLPEWARPSTTASNLSGMGSTALARLDARSDGSVLTVTRDFAGAGVSTTSLAAEYTLSYSVTDTSSALMSTTALMNQTANASYYSAATQNIGHDTWTAITFNTKVVDPQNVCTTSPWKYISPCRQRVTIHAATLVANTTGWEKREVIQLAAYVNGVSTKTLAVSYMESSDSSPDASFDFYALGSGVVDLERGDQLQVYVYQVNGTTVTLSAGQTTTFVDVTPSPDFTVYGAYGDGTSPTMPEVKTDATQRTVNYSTDEYVPIVASGSNADGKWVKFADGTMICTGNALFNGVAFTTGSGGGFRTAPTSVNMPMTFIAAPDVNVSIYARSLTYDIFGATFSVATSTFQFLGVALTSRTQDIGVRYTALGRWK